MNDGFSNAPQGQPAPFAQATVWPPPPTVGPQSQSGWAGLVCGFKWLYRRAPGKMAAKAMVADYRVGTLHCDGEGIIIDGKAVPRAEIRMMVVLPAILLNLLLGVIANLVMEYGMRRDRREGIRWGSIKQITLSPAKQQAAIVYDAYNHAAQIKTYSLAFTPAPGQYEAFAEAGHRNAPDRLAEAALVSATPVAVWILLGLVVFVMLALVALALHML